MRAQEPIVETQQNGVYAESDFESAIVNTIFDMADIFSLSIHVALLVSACFASPRLPLSGKHPRLPRSSSGW